MMELRKRDGTLVAVDQIAKTMCQSERIEALLYWREVTGEHLHWQVPRQGDQQTKTIGEQYGAVRTQR